MTTHPSAYDLALNPPYQIDYRAKRAGKRISASKRRVTFRFGFSRAVAVAAGCSGGECRGAEHEVVLVWSIVTGKRRLCMDGNEVHVSQAARANTTFEFSWPVFGGHLLKISARGTPPQSSSGQRQFDLELDGMSFFLFKQIYELGFSQAPPSVFHRGSAQDVRDDVDEEFAGEGLPVDFFDTSTLVSPTNRYSPVPSLIGSMASSSSGASYDEFSPVETACDERKSFEAVSDEILCAYNNVPSVTLQKVAPGSISSRVLVPVSEESIDQVTKSMQSLVNLDDITTKPVRPMSLNSPSLHNSTRKSQANWGLIGRAPTLSEIRDSATTLNPAVAQAGPIQTCLTPVRAPSYHGHAGSHSMTFMPAATH